MRAQVDLNVELLVVAGCPNEIAAAELLRILLEDVGRGEVGVTTTVITTTEQAAQRGFTGSPTILIDGNDPFAEPGAVPALACRVYATPSGPNGVPDLCLLRQALKRAAAADGRTTDGP